MIRSIRPALFMCLIALLIITQTGCSSDAEPVSADNYYLDTVCTISIYGMDDGQGEMVPAADVQEEAEAAISDAWDLCASLDKTLSRTRDESDIGRINSAGGEWTEVSDDTITLIQAGMKYAEISGGDFDITIGGVTELWDFHADPEDASVPAEGDISEAVKHVGADGIEIDGNRVRLKDPETKLDLGGIAKGYIGDRMTELLEQKGVRSGIVNLGGNVICIGGRPSSSGDSEKDFTIGVEAPYSDRSEIVGTIPSRDKTLVTSGVYERMIEVDGKMYHHVLDPATGYPAETDLIAVTLTAPKGSSMDIDALSTTCLIKGLDGAKELINGIDRVEAVFILEDGSVETTDGAGFVKED